MAQSVEGQSDGSMVMGLGMAFYEDLYYKNGSYLNTSLLDYLIPTSMDIPQNISSKLIDTLEPLGPLGAKEAGEGLLVAVSPAIANAIYDAAGLRITDVPITPDKIKDALEMKIY